MTPTPEELKAEEAKKKADEEAAAKAKADADAKAKAEEEKRRKKDEAEDPLYAELDRELHAKLGDDVYNDFKDKPLKERVLLLRSIAKAVDKNAPGGTKKPEDPPIDKSKEPKDPSAGAAGKKQLTKTLAETNNIREFNKKYTQRSSMLGVRDKLLEEK